jgi:predicted Zn-dependent protease with MMP-like domain
MTPEAFEALVAVTWNAMPERFKAHVKNVALLLEDEPNEQVRKEENLRPGHTLLGLYHGISITERGETYGVGATLPDTITLYRLPLMDEAHQLLHERPETLHTMEEAVAEAVRETLWHEVGHYFGLSEHEIDKREEEGTNAFDT